MLSAKQHEPTGGLSEAKEEYMKTTIEFKWALIAVLLSSLLTVVLTSENHGGGFVLQKGFQCGIGWAKTFDPTLKGYGLYVIPIGLVPALGILGWQYVRARKSKKDNIDTHG